MKRKVVIPGEVSRKIRGFQLPRELLVRLLAEIHSRDFQPKQRSLDDDRFFWYRVSLLETGQRHLFVVLVDDSTSPDHLLLVDVRYSVV